MYEKWLADDGKDLELNREAIKQLSDQIQAVKNSQANHESLLGDKADALEDKEDILMVSLANQCGFFRGDWLAHVSQIMFDVFLIH